jgi:hypothetical protein
MNDETNTQDDNITETIPPGVKATAQTNATATGTVTQETQAVQFPAQKKPNFFFTLLKNRKTYVFTFLFGFVSASAIFLFLIFGGLGGSNWFKTADSKRATEQSAISSLTHDIIIETQRGYILLEGEAGLGGQASRFNQQAEADNNTIAGYNRQLKQGLSNITTELQGIADEIDSVTKSSGTTK